MPERRREKRKWRREISIFSHSLSIYFSLFLFLIYEEILTCVFSFSFIRVALLYVLFCHFLQERRTDIYLCRVTVVLVIFISVQVVIVVLLCCEGPKMVYQVFLAEKFFLSLFRNFSVFFSGPLNLFFFVRLVIIFFFFLLQPPYFNGNVFPLFLFGSFWHVWGVDH